MWKQGAILQSVHDGQYTYYAAIEDVWDNVPLDLERITSPIIEDLGNAKFFERVYPDTLKGGVYRTKDRLVELYNNAFKE